MRLDRIIGGGLLALGLIATAGPSVNYINTILNSGVRWLVLLSIISFLILKNKLFIGFRGASLVYALALLTLAAFSTIWSTVPQLSGSKSATFFAVAVAYSSAGAYWLQRARRKSAMNVLWPLAVLALIASLGGTLETAATVQMNETVALYRGLTFNSNFLGMLILATLPLPLWRMSQSAISVKERWFYYILLASMLLILASTFSRASMLGAGILIFFYVMGRGMSRFILVLLGGILILLAAPAFFPDQTADFVAQYIYKGGDATEGLLASREDTFNASLEGALQGGVFGLGYGVSYGFDDFSVGFASSGYGREKANLFLAIVEETGIVGLGLFLGMLLSLLGQGYAAINGARDQNTKLLLYLLVGYIVGLTVHAQFEAWMFSPGAALSPAFWAAIGMLTQLSREILRKRSVKGRALRADQRELLSSAYNRQSERTSDV